LGSLVEKLGSEKAVVQNVLYQIYKRGYPDGVYPGTGLTFNIGGTDVVVRGVMINGVFKSGTMFVPPQ
jgi:hypothetical protein